MPMKSHSPAGTPASTYDLPQFKILLEWENRPNIPVQITSPKDVVQFLKPLRLSAEERFVSIHLNSKHQVIGLHEVSHGTLSTSLVHPREVFKAALLANSFAIVVCHNHPSGAVIMPSPEDLQTTQQLHKAGQLLGVSLIDHLIVSPSRACDSYSVREHHPEIWSV